MPLEPDDIAAMYNRHAGELLRFLARRTFDPDAAVDLLAETFAVAFEDRNQFRGEGADTADGEKQMAVDNFQAEAPEHDQEIDDTPRRVWPRQHDREPLSPGHDNSRVDRGEMPGWEP